VSPGYLRRRAARVAGSLAIAGLLALDTAGGQDRDLCRGPERADPPIDVTLDDLALSTSYRRKAVKTRGDLETEVDASGRRRYTLREGRERVAVVPCFEVGRDLEDFTGRRPRLEVTGLASENPEAESGSNPRVPATRILIWSFTDISNQDRPRRPTAGAGLTEVMGAGDAQIGRTVRVTGQFGGRNLLKDLPADSAPDDSAWVLRDGSQAIWIVGKRAEGPGFKLDPAYASDAGKWLVVEGKLERCGALLCVRARRVTLSGPPS
jgi:hypothetical protein